MIAASIKAGLKSASATEPSDLQQLTFVAWASVIPEDAVTPAVTHTVTPASTNTVATEGGGGETTPLKKELAMLPSMAGDSGFGSTLSKFRPIGRRNHNTKRSARRGAVGGEGGAQGLEARCHTRANQRRATKGNAFQNKRQRVTRRPHTKERDETARA
jgi:hypothetical protein